MKRTVLLFFAVFVGVPSTFSSSASMNGLNTAEIVQYTTEAINDCLQWKLVGQCFWLHCGLTGCEIRTSPKVSHYRPDLVVAVQLEHQELAWIEMNELLEASRQLALVTIVGATSPYSVEGGGVPATIRAGSRRSLRFYEADVFGHPLESMPAQQVLFCDGITQALRPYYQSVLDAIAWREPLLDISLQSLNPLGTNVGSLLDVWGSIKPRCGWVNQPDPYKAAAVIAFRAVHLLTHPTPLHVSLPLHSSSSSSYHPPTPIRPGAPRTGVWQPLFPVKSTSCTAFGTSYPIPQPGAKPSYLWNLWRSYTCCPRAGQTYLGDINF